MWKEDLSEKCGSLNLYWLDLTVAYENIQSVIAQYKSKSILVRFNSLYDNIEKHVCNAMV